MSERGYEIDAEVNFYLDQLMTNQWNLSAEFHKQYPNEQKMKQYRAKIYSLKYKIAKRIWSIQQGYAKTNTMTIEESC